MVYVVICVPVKLWIVDNAKSSKVADNMTFTQSSISMVTLRRPLSIDASFGDGSSVSAIIM